jgi:hypothetical protein
MKKTSILLLALALAPIVGWAGNISTMDKYAWSENAGWLNFSATHDSATVHENGANGYLSGYAWGENIGWIKLGADAGGPYANTSANNWGVNMNAAGELSGYAWSEVAGWINFNPTHSQVVVDANGRFDGYAWSEALGWIRTRNASVPYALAWLAPGSNVDGDDKYAWYENAGWLNFRPTYGGVTVHEAGNNGYLSGSAWSEGAGWVKLGVEAGGPYANTAANNWGVNMNAARELSGYAWSETAGWLNFDPAHSQVTIGADGRFAGYAWSEGLGWLHVRGTGETPLYAVVLNVPTLAEISGRVINQNSGQAIEGAQVTVGSVTVTTGADGTFSVPVNRGWSGTVSVEYAPAAVFVPAQQVVTEAVGEQPADFVMGWGASTVDILDVAAASSVDGADLDLALTSGARYDVYRSDDPLSGTMTWSPLHRGAASADFTDETLTTAHSRRFYAVRLAGEAPSTQKVWGVIRATAREATYTLMSPPVRTDRKFNGELGAMLAERLAGDDTQDGDRVHILGSSGAWRTLYLDSQKVWRESGGAASTYELPVGAGFFVERKSGSPAPVTFTGPVGNDGTRTNRLAAGWNMIGLSEGKILPVKETMAGANPVGSATEDQADQIVLQNPNGSWRRLIYIQGWGAPYDGNWFDLQTFAVVTNKLDPGAAYYYLRRGGATDVKF